MRTKLFVMMAVIAIMMTAFGAHPKTAWAGTCPACMTVRDEDERADCEEKKCKQAAPVTPTPVEPAAQPAPVPSGGATHLASTKTPKEVACDLNKKPKKGEVCTSCKDPNASVMNGSCSCNSGHDVRNGICTQIVQAITCTPPQVDINGTCGCADPMAEGPQCACIKGAVQMTFGAKKNMCASFTPAFATLEDLNHIDVAHTARWWALGLSILALLIICGLIFWIFLVKKEAKENVEKLRKEQLIPGLEAKKKELEDRLSGVNQLISDAEAGLKIAEGEFEVFKVDLEKIEAAEKHSGALSKMAASPVANQATKDKAAKAAADLEDLRGAFDPEAAGTVKSAMIAAENDLQTLRTEKGKVEKELAHVKAKLIDLGASPAKGSNLVPAAEELADDDVEELLDTPAAPADKPKKQGGKKA